MSANVPVPPKRERRLNPWVLVCLGIMSLLLIALSSFTVWRLSLGRQIPARLDGIRKAGEPATTRDLEVYYAKVADAENAALVWKEGIEALNPPYNRNQASPWGKIKFPQRGAKLSELDNAARIIGENEEALKIFRRAAGMKKVRYPVDLTPGLAALLPHLPQLKSIGTLLRLEAAVAVQSGRADDAASAALTILGAGESLRSEPLLISQLIRMALNGMASLSAESTLNLIRLEEPQLLKLQTAFQEADDADALYRGLLGDRATGVTTIHLPDELPPQSHTVLQEDGIGVEDMKAFGSPAVRMTGFFQRDCRFFLDAMATNLASVHLPDPDRFKSRTTLDDLALRSRKGFYPFSSMLLPALSNALLRDIENRARMRVSHTAMAIERYRMANGKVPASLEALVPRFLREVPKDPVDGEPLRFKLLPRGYVVYSIGTDERDDGGRPKVPDNKRPRQNNVDVTFTVEREKQ